MYLVQRVGVAVNLVQAGTENAHTLFVLELHEHGCYHAPAVRLEPRTKPLGE